MFLKRSVISLSILVCLLASIGCNLSSLQQPSPTTPPQTTSDLVVRSIVLIDSQSNRRQEVLVENVGSSSYCYAEAIVPLYAWPQAISSQTFADNSGSLRSDCLRPGDFGVLYVYLSSSDTPLTAADLTLQGTKTTILTPDPQLTISAIGPSDPTMLPYYPYTVTLANQSQKTASRVRGVAILKDAYENFLGYVDLDYGYPASFPMGDDRCMFAGSSYATYDCIKHGKTKDFGIQKLSDYDWGSVASIEVLPQWENSGEEILFDPTSHTTIHLAAFSGKLTEDEDAVFERDGTLFFNGLGYGSGERGINVATIDPKTGVVLDLKSYDTWADSGAADRLVSFLETLPNGTIIMMAVADEGSAQLGTSSRDDITRLLGSQLIQNLGYWDRWAMISAIGQAAALSEQLVPYAEVGTKEAEADWNLILP